MSPPIPLPRRPKSRVREAYEAWQAGRFVRRARQLAGRPRSQQRALVFPAAGLGSLGDEAMLLASGQVLHRHRIDRLTILSYGPGEPWPPMGNFDDVVSLGNRYSTSFWDTCEDLLVECASATHMVIQGADVMDGFYSPLEAFRRATYARVAAAAGLRTTIGGFSFNNSPHPRSVRSLAALPQDVRLVARDPVSWRRLTSLISRPVHAGADMAFLLEPATGIESIAPHQTWIDGQRSVGRLVLGVNANYLVAADRDRDDAGSRLAAAFAAGLAPSLTAAQPVSLLLMPHDHRAMAGRFTDLELLEAIAARLPSELAEHVRFVRERLDAAEIKALAGSLDAVISGRMHLAIAALGQGVPAAGITYQGKFEGLYEHFGLDGLCLSPSALLDGALDGFLVELLSRRGQLAALITEALPRVQDLARVNFENLVDGVGGSS